MINPSQTWKKTRSFEFLKRILPTSIVVSLYPSSLDIVMHNNRAYDK
jgi:hypothetical protein